MSVVEQRLMGIVEAMMSGSGHILASGASLIAAFGIGSVASAWITGIKNKQNGISSMRREWINSLREDLAEFAGYAQKFDRYITIYKKTEVGTDRSNQVRDVIEDLRAKKSEFSHKIIMQLNPFEKDHIALDIIVRRMNSGYSEVHRNVFRHQAQKVLKREWSVVKDGAMNRKKHQKWEKDWIKNQKIRRSHYDTVLKLIKSREEV